MKTCIHLKSTLTYLFNKYQCKKTKIKKVLQDYITYKHHITNAIVINQNRLTINGMSKSDIQLIIEAHIIRIKINWYN